MNLTPTATAYTHLFKTIDSHTMGEATRIIYDGFPEISGATMMEKKKFLSAHYDHYRTSLMLEPRGHRDMFGALLTSPTDPDADLGVIFMNSGGYLNMCGHGSIGVAIAAVETGLVEAKEPYTQVVLEVPSGLIHTQVHVENGRAVRTSLLNVPSFLYKEGLQLELPDYGTITYDISFGGSFFALVDAEQIGLELSSQNIHKITELGIAMKEKINQQVRVQHPYLDISTVDLVEFYARPTPSKADLKNCVIFGNAQADRSPCGTGLSAKLATLYAKGKLGLHQPLICESITGSLFIGEAVQETEVDGRPAIIPQITGSAYITGMNQWILDENDPLRFGFLLNNE